MHPLLFGEWWSRVHKFLLYYWVDVCLELTTPGVYILLVPKFITGIVRTWGKDNLPYPRDLKLDKHEGHKRQAHITCNIVRLLTF